MIGILEWNKENKNEINYSKQEINHADYTQTQALYRLELDWEWSVIKLDNWTIYSNKAIASGAKCIGTKGPIYYRN